MASAGELTVSQGGLGSPPYMSPEQVKSAKHVDFRADIYSLGATLYALLAGKAPFAGTSAYEIMHKVVTDAPVSLRELKPDLSRAMETTVARCLQKDPEKRFASYQDLCGALEHVSGGTGAEALTAESVQGVVTSARAGGGEPPREQDRGRKETEQPAVPWFYAMKGKRTGPVEFAVLRDLVEKGMLKGEDLVWRKGLKEWAPVSRVEGLFPDLGSENRLSPRLSGSQVDAGSKPPPLTKAPSTAPEIVRWYYADGNDRSGPVDWDTLQRFAATNQITPRTLVWKEGMKDWQPAANVGELVFNVACTEGVPVEHDASAYERHGQRGW
jgi:hypothetical protein